MCHYRGLKTISEENDFIVGLQVYQPELTRAKQYHIQCTENVTCLCFSCSWWDSLSPKIKLLFRGYK